MRKLIAGARQIELSTPCCMGIINSTPDSFSDGSKFSTNSNKTTSFKPDIPSILTTVQEMVKEGALFIDVGGESTRPGASEISVDEELDRVVPVIEAIHERFDVCISADTSSPQVMAEAILAGAELINDVRALSREGALEVVADSSVAVCLMHMQGKPESMQDTIAYNDIVTEVYEFLEERVSKCLERGIEEKRILIDPGFGFGKSLDHNYNLLRNLSHFSQMGLPLLVGLSRKSMIGNVIDRPVDQRLAGSVAATSQALIGGASIIRTHDVAATMDAIRVHCAYQNA